ncbi:hypothetical protein D3C76_1806650 [compost metagenome]
MALPRLDAAAREHEIAIDPGVHQQQLIAAQHHGPDCGALEHPPVAADLRMEQTNVEGIAPLRR